MQSCPRACQRAVQRQLSTPPDSIWISEDVLDRSFQRFVSLSKSTRRYGSFVPGPLESRRRLGKRRMAQLSESTPTSPYSFPPAWNLFGEVDRSKFQWEPPAATTPRDDTAGISNWLQGFITPAPPPPVPELPTTMPASSISMSEEFTSEDINTFQENVRQASEDDFVELCEDFSNRLKQSLILGEVSSTTVISALGCYRYVMPASTLRESLSLTLCRSAWDGLTACKVVPLSDIDGLVMGKLIDVLSNLPMSLEVRTFAHGIVCSATTPQLNKMRQSIIKLVDAWAKTWLIDDAHAPTDMSMMEAERAVDSVQVLLRRSDRLVAAWKRSNKQKERNQKTSRGNAPRTWTLQRDRSRSSASTKMQCQSGFRTLSLQRVRIRAFRNSGKLVMPQFLGKPQVLKLQRDRTSLLSDLLILTRGARKGIDQSINAVDLAENSSTHQSSVSTLAEMLNHIDKHSGLMSAVISICSAHLKKAIDETLHESRFILRYHWLSTVAQIPNINDNLFIQTLKLFEGHGERALTRRSTAALILERWIAQGVVKQPLLVRNGVKAKQRSRGPFSDLISTLKKYKEPWWTRTEEIFALFQRLGRHRFVYHILRAMFARRMVLHTPIIGRAINDMSSVDIRKAYRIYQLWLPLRPDRVPLRHWKCPNFVLSMIQSKQFGSAEIWKTLNILGWDKEAEFQGFFAYRDFPGFSKDLNDRLSPAMVTLISKMAVAFSEARTARAGIREVSRCLLFLRIRGTTVPPEVTKALTRVGITMPMIKGVWINQFRVGWLLKMIEQAEGTPAAERIDRLVYLYKRDYKQKQARQMKRAQPPKFGWGRPTD